MALAPRSRGSATEEAYFQYYLTWTSANLHGTLLAFSEVCVNFILPVSFNNQTVRKTSAALGAAHQLFLSKKPHGHSGQTLSATRTPTQMEVCVFQQYNEAISSINSHLAPSSGSDPHLVVLCCLQFICMETLLGRHEEAKRHFEAGVKMLSWPDTLKGICDKSLVYRFNDRFARFGMELSACSGDNDLRKYGCDPPDKAVVDSVDDLTLSKPFGNVAEASSAMKTIDLLFMREFGPPDFELPLPLYQVTWAEYRARLLGQYQLTDSQTSAVETIREKFDRWSIRLTLTLDKLKDLNVDLHQWIHLQFQQRHWQVFFTRIACEKGEVPQQAVEDAWYAYLDVAELAAQAYTTNNHLPTFSMDGEIMSGLSWLLTSSTERGVKDRASQLLRSLNRREGPGDSEVVIRMPQPELDREGARIPTEYS
ncbi:hypothetical protein HJFPF1_00163 [Paramyrothecium foliicola]|nr:hypothetical protein HJFPF1_00163 [Paramyrothecium foliicola]